MKTTTFKIALLLFFIMNAATAQIGIGTTSPTTTLDTNGAISLREASPLTLANGANSNVSLGTTAYSFYRITGPTGAFSLNGLVPVTTADGQIVTLENTTSQTFTINHDVTSTAANRIYCPGATDLVLSGQYASVTLSYNKTQSRWIVIGVVDNPYGKNIQSVVGTTDTSINTNTYTDMTDMTITFTPKHSVVYFSFSAAGTMNTTLYPEACYANFRLVNGAGTTLAGTTSLVTDYDYDDTIGEVVAVSWNAQFVMYPVAVTAGVSTTLKIQWMRNGSYTRTLLNNASTSKNDSHRNITIFD